jgi:hypothetical protein
MTVFEFFSYYKDVLEAKSVVTGLKAMGVPTRLLLQDTGLFLFVRSCDFDRVKRVAVSKMPPRRVKIPLLDSDNAVLSENEKERSYVVCA